MPEITTPCRPTRSATIAIAGRRIPFRVCLFWAGVTFWLGNMIVHTGSYGIAELWASLSFVTELVVITTATRTVTLDRVASLYCWGGAMMGVMWLIGSAFTFFRARSKRGQPAISHPHHGGVAENCAGCVHGLARAQVTLLGHGSERPYVDGRSQWRRVWVGRGGLFSSSLWSEHVPLTGFSLPVSTDPR